MGCTSSRVPATEGPMMEPPAELHNFRANLVPHYERDIEEMYEIDEGTLGEAAMGCMVRGATHKVTGIRVAVKTFMLREAQEQSGADANGDGTDAAGGAGRSRGIKGFFSGSGGVSKRARAAEQRMLNYLRNEIELLRNVDHPNVIRPFATFEWEGSLHLTMELCTGGDLASRKYTEEQARRVIHKLVTVLGYCHSMNICHRDLKAENVLFENASEDSEIKVIDFGMSKKFREDNPSMHDKVGTVYTMAPEVLIGDYTTKCDMWSIGVITFQLLTGAPPFEGDTDEETIDQLAACNFRWPAQPRVSGLARDFVNHLIVFDPKRRWSAQRALISHWMREETDQATVRRDSPMKRKPSFAGRVVASLDSYQQSSLFRKTALMVVAFSMGPQHVADLRETFQHMDSENNGTLSHSELRQGLRSIGVDENEIDGYFESIDVDQSGRIQYLEFLAATIEAMGELEDDFIIDAFSKLDTDNSGFISRENLQQVLGSDYKEDVVEQMIAEADLDRNNQINFEEFRAAMRRNAAETLREEQRAVTEIQRRMDANADAEAEAAVDVEAPVQEPAQEEEETTEPDAETEAAAEETDETQAEVEVSEPDAEAETEAEETDETQVEVEVSTETSPPTLDPQAGVSPPPLDAQAGVSPPPLDAQVSPPPVGSE